MAMTDHSRTDTPSMTSPEINVNMRDALVPPGKSAQTTRISNTTRWVLIAVFTIGLLTASIYFVIAVTQFQYKVVPTVTPSPINVDYNCRDTCSYTIVESIPQNLTFNGTVTHPSTFKAWQTLLDMATETIDIASFYWSLNGSDLTFHDETSQEGETILNGLLEAGTKRNIDIRVAQSKPSGSQPDNDTVMLEEKGAITLRSLDFDKLVGAGILHTKLWIVDKKHFYVGSANMDWRSLTQVKELGSLTTNCSCLATDMQKIFDVYWDLGAPNATIPAQWPQNYTTYYNKMNPLHVDFAQTGAADVYLASSPPQFCPQGRTSDIDAILDIINNAQEFIHIAVMDYFPKTIYTHPKKSWFVIDEALRKAAFDRDVQVRVMGSWWNHTSKDMPYLLESLKLYSTHIQVKLFEVPVFSEAQRKIPYARVNHNKYMVTENVAYIGTSNWSGDYFIDTGGVGYVVSRTSTNGTSIPRQLQDIFERDWNSSYAHPVTDYMKM